MFQINHSLLCEELNFKVVQKQPPETFYKKVFLKISQDKQGNTCARVSILIEVQALACNFIKKTLSNRCYPVSFEKFLRALIFSRTSLGGCFWEYK